MKLIKKLTALILAGAVAVSCMISGASADNISTIKIGKSVTETIETNSTSSYYIEVEKSGVLSIKFSYTSSYIAGLLIGDDSDGSAKILKPDSVDSTAGESGILEINGGYGFIVVNDDAKKCAGTAKYSITKGKYLIMFSNQNSSSAYNGSGKLTLTTSIGSKSATLTQFTVTIKKGSTLQLGALADTSADGVKWSSSKKSVATVNSKGKVTAKKAGTAVITAKLGSSKLQITVNVK